MAINGLNVPLSGLTANQLRQDVTANNIANANTDGFQASTVQTTDAAYINDIGQGTQVAGTYAPARPGPVAPDAATTGATTGAAEMSNVDLIAEKTNQMSAQRAYGANIPVLQTMDQMSQALMGLKGEG